MALGSLTMALVEVVHLRLRIPTPGPLLRHHHHLLLSPPWTRLRNLLRPGLQNILLHQVTMPVLLEVHRLARPLIIPPAWQAGWLFRQEQ